MLIRPVRTALTQESADSMARRPVFAAAQGNNPGVGAAGDSEESKMTLARVRLSWSEVCTRAAWMLLAGVHVMPLFRVSSSLVHDGVTAGRLGTWGLVAGCLAFFLMKVCGARLLRVRCSRMGLATFVVCCGLAHGDAAADWAAGHGDRTLVAVAATVGGAGTAGLVGRGLRRRLPEWLDGLIGLGTASSLMLGLRVRFASLQMRARGWSVPVLRRVMARGPPMGALRPAWAF
jgi:hypothetical protein